MALIIDESKLAEEAVRRLDPLITAKLAEIKALVDKILSETDVTVTIRFTRTPQP